MTSFDPKRPELLKTNRHLVIDDIHFGKVIAIDSYDASAHAIIKNLAKYLLYDFQIICPKGMGDKVFLYSLSYAKRSDYDEIKDLFLKFCNEFSLIEVGRVKSSKHIIIKFLRIIKAFFKCVFCGIPAPVLSSILITEYHALYVQYMKSFDWDNISMLGTFCDAIASDNLATQIAKSKGIKSFTLQHGQYRILRPEYENADAESYKNFISDKLLAWGEATRHEFEKAGINADRIVPVGALKPFSFNCPMNALPERKVFGVVLCGDTYSESNVGMIKIANEIAKHLGYKYFLRLHPRNDVNHYLKFVDNIYLDEYSSNISNSEYVSKVNFSLIHMTGVFVEMLSINSPIFVYDDDYLEDLFRIQGFCFKNSSDLLKLLEKYKFNMAELRKEQYKLYEYFNNSEELESNYRSAIEQLETL